jgi:hypothetical protein
MTTLLEPAVTAAQTHHEELRRALVRHTEYLIAAAASNTPHEPAQRRLVEFLRTELLPHTAEEEDLIDVAADTESTGLLAHVMQDEHRLLGVLSRVVEHATHPIDAAVAAGALAVLFDVCVLLEDDHLLPALSGTDIDLNALLAEDLPAADTAQSAS